MQKLSQKVSRGGQAARSDRRPLAAPKTSQPSWAPQIALKMPQGRPQIAPRGYKTNPRCTRSEPTTAKSALGAAQERSKSGQEGSWNDLGAILQHFGAILGSNMCVFRYVFHYFL